MSSSRRSAPLDAPSSPRAQARPRSPGCTCDSTRDDLRLAGVDRDLTIQTHVTVAGTTDGAVVLPSRLAVDIVRSLEPGAVTVESGDEDVVRISSGRSQFSVRLLPVEEFPRLSPPAGDPVTLEAAALAGALRQVVRAASTDNDRPVLTGVLVAATETGLRLVATDSYRLAVRDLAGSAVLAAGQKVLLPSRALAELQRLLSGGASDVSLRLGEFEAHFDVGPTRLTTAPVGGRLPQLRQPDPEGLPQPAGGGQGRHPRRRATGPADDPRRHHTGAAVAAPRRGRADRHHP